MYVCMYAYIYIYVCIYICMYEVIDKLKLSPRLYFFRKHRKAIITKTMTKKKTLPSPYQNSPHWLKSGFTTK